MPYADLELSLRPWKEREYSIEMRLVTSDSEADERLDPPDPPLLQIDDEALLAASLVPEAYGAILTAALFRDPRVLVFYSGAEKKARDLKVTLRFRLSIQRSAAHLHRYRWETLRCPLDPSLSLTTRQDVAFSRYLSSLDWRPVRPRRGAEPLKSLVVIADGDPKPRRLQLSPIFVPAELKRARAGLATTSITVIAERGKATLDGLVAALREGCDVLYLVCHGALVEGQPILFLENDLGEAVAVQGAELAMRMRELKDQPRLVILVSCESAGAHAGPESGESAGAGAGKEPCSADDGALAALGPRLAEAGVPAVIAMQGRVLMRTVAEFMPVFFAELMRDGVVDAAVAAARGKVRARSDMYMPVLFMRLRTGRLWYEPGIDGKANTFTNWVNLLSDLRNGNCTPILGAGVLEPVLGSTRDIAQRWAESFSFPMSPVEREDLPRVAQYLAVNWAPSYPSSLLGDYACREVRRRFGDLGLGPKATANALLSAAAAQLRQGDGAEAHSVLASLHCRIYITTNPDNLLAEALQSAGKAPQVRTFDWRRDTTGEPREAKAPLVEVDPNDDDDARPPRDKPVVYHLFGRFDAKRSPPVVTEDDYFDFLIGVRENRKTMPDVVGGALADSGLLFLGFRIDDWSFRVLLHAITRLQGGSRRERYTNIAVQIDPERDRIGEPELARRYVEKYLGSAHITIYWGKLEEFLGELRDQWAQGVAR